MKFLTSLVYLKGMESYWLFSGEDKAKCHSCLQQVTSVETKVG